MLKLLVKNGRIINPAVGQDEIGDILIENGKIVAIGGAIDTEDSVVYDAAGMVVVPGLIDMHTHLREPGQEAKEDFYSGTQAAAAGGITRVATMANTVPVVDNAVVVRGMKARAAEAGVVKIEIIGAVSKGLKGEQLAELGDMALAGVVAFSDDGHYVSNAGFMRKALEYASMFNKIVIEHAEDDCLIAGGQMHEGRVSQELGLKGRPATAEDVAVARDVLLSEMTSGRIHIAHVSSKETVDMIRQAKAKGLAVTAEVTAQHLSLTDECLRTFDPAFKTAPPLRSEDHRQALIAGLKDGTIDAIITDHAPHAFEEKDMEFNLAPNGFSGLETSLGAVLTNLYHTGLVDLQTIVAAMTVNPAKLLGVDAGVLAVGKDADITVFDLDKKWTVHCADFYTRGKISPFEGQIFVGKAMLTIVNGDIIMEDGVVLR